MRGEGRRRWAGTCLALAAFAMLVVALAASAVPGGGEAMVAQPTPPTPTGIIWTCPPKPNCECQPMHWPADYCADWGSSVFCGWFWGPGWTPMACYWVTPATTTTTTTITTTNTTTTTTTTTAATTPTTTAQAQAGNQTPGDHSWYWDPNAPPWNAMLQLALQTPGEFVLHSLTLRASGTGDDALGVAAVDLAWDVNANGAYDNGTDVLLASGAYAADDGTLTLAPSPAAALPHGALLLIVYEMMSQAREEDTFTFQVTAVSIEDAETHATLPVSGLPVAGCMKTTVRGPTTATTTATTTAPGVIYIFGIPWWIWVAVLLLALVVLVLVALLWRQRRRQQEAGR